MPAISVSHLQKHFKIHTKKPGFKESFKSIFSRHYEMKKAVDDISFTIEEGELIGFIGPNGAGKTTTLKSLSGLLYPTSGNIKVLGFEPFLRKHAFLKQIALVMGQKNQLWWDLPAEESFLLNKEIYGVTDSEYKKTSSELIDLLDASEVLRIPVRNLSLGQRMKCELIAALLHKPKVLFLDEPTIGLDVVVQKNLRHFIREYNKRSNATIILTSHYMEDVKQLCKRLIVINHGKIMYDGGTDDIIKKFSRNKIISLQFESPVEKKDLETLGEVKDYSSMKVTLVVPIAKSNHIAATLLDKYPVADISIADPHLEDIIRDFFETM